LTGGDFAGLHLDVRNVLVVKFITTNFLIACAKLLSRNAEPEPKALHRTSTHPI
jgi:hypothetical protein